MTLRISRRGSMGARAVLVGILAIGSAGCDDPVQDTLIAALPPEVAGIRTGPMHRAGQSCPLCHSSYGGVHPTFTVAGTLFQKPTNRVGVEGATVHVVDATGASQDLTTNCVGNFYIADSQWQPTFPVWVSVSDAATGETSKMISKIGRDNGCAECHSDPAGTDSPGHVYLTKDPSVPDATPPAMNCGGGPGGPGSSSNVGTGDGGT